MITYISKRLLCPQFPFFCDGFDGRRQNFQKYGNSTTSTRASLDFRPTFMKISQKCHASETINSKLWYTNSSFFRSPFCACMFVLFSYNRKEERWWQYRSRFKLNPTNFALVTGDDGSSTRISIWNSSPCKQRLMKYIVCSKVHDTHLFKARNSLPKIPSPFLKLFYPPLFLFHPSLKVQSC